MNDVIDLLASIRTLRIRLTRDGDDLIAEGAVTEGLAAELQQHKAEPSTA